MFLYVFLCIRLLMYSSLGTSDRHVPLLFAELCTDNKKSYPSFLLLPHINKLYQATWHTKPWSFHRMAP